MLSIEDRALKLAKQDFHSKGMLFTKEAKFTYPDFDPCRCEQIIIRVDIPALIGMRETVFTRCYTEKEINRFF